MFGTHAQQDREEPSFVFEVVELESVLSRASPGRGRLDTDTCLYCGGWINSKTQTYYPLRTKLVKVRPKNRLNCLVHLVQRLANPPTDTLPFHTNCRLSTRSYFVHDFLALLKKVSRGRKTDFDQTLRREKSPR